MATPEYNGSCSPLIQNAFYWLSRTYQPDYTPLHKKKVGIVSASYLTQQQIKDIEYLGSDCNINVFGESFYVGLKTGAFDMETGNLTKGEEKDKLAVWYQDFSHFIMSGK